MKRLSMLIALMCIMIIPVMQLQAQVVGDDLVGSWVDAKTNDVYEVTKVNGKYQATIVELGEPIDPDTGDSIRDKYNRNESLKNRFLKGITFMKDCEYNNKWTSDNYYYYPKGKIYGCKIEPLVEGNSKILKVTRLGFLVSDRTTYWTKRD